MREGTHRKYDSYYTACCKIVIVKFWSIRKEKVASAAFPAMFINEETYLVRWKEVVCHTVTHDTLNTCCPMVSCLLACQNVRALLLRCPIAMACTSRAINAVI